MCCIGTHASGLYPTPYLRTTFFISRTVVDKPQRIAPSICDSSSSTQRSDKKDSEATAARLKGNRFYKAKRWEKALELYMASLKARPYAVNTLANVAQVGNELTSPRPARKSFTAIFVDHLPIYARRTPPHTQSDGIRRHVSLPCFAHVHGEELTYPHQHRRIVATPTHNFKPRGGGRREGFNLQVMRKIATHYCWGGGRVTR